MGCRIMYDREQSQAALYCSTTDWAFGPVFTDGDKSLGYRDAEERAMAFLRWLNTYTPPTWDVHNVRNRFPGWRHDPRELTDSGLEAAHGLWLAQEAEQYAREEAKSQMDEDTERSTR